MRQPARTRPCWRRSPARETEPRQQSPRDTSATPAARTAHPATAIRHAGRRFTSRLRSQRDGELPSWRRARLLAVSFPAGPALRSALPGETGSHPPVPDPAGCCEMHSSGARTTMSPSSSCAQQHLTQRRYHRAPARLLCLELPPARRRRLVDSRGACSRWSPTGSDPTRLFHPVQRRIERAFLHAQDVIRHPYDVRRNLVSVLRSAVRQYFQNQQRKGTLKSVLPAISSGLGFGPKLRAVINGQV